LRAPCLILSWGLVLVAPVSISRRGSSGELGVY
jgi:hypothetical protein